MMGSSEYWQRYKYFNTVESVLPSYFIIWSNAYYTHIQHKSDSAVFSWDLLNRVIKKLRDLIRVPHESFDSVIGINKY